MENNEYRNPSETSVGYWNLQESLHFKGLILGKGWERNYKDMPSCQDLRQVDRIYLLLGWLLA